VTAGQPVMTAKILEIQGILIHTGIILEIGIILIIGIHPGIIMTGILDVILTLGIRLIQVIRIDKPEIDLLKVLENLDTIGILLDSVRTLVQGQIIRDKEIHVMYPTRITLDKGILEMIPDTDQTIIPRTGMTITLKIGLITPDNAVILETEVTTLDVHLTLLTRVHLETILGKISIVIQIPNILWIEHRVGTGWITSLERISFQT
jgi:hypothetical protein